MIGGLGLGGRVAAGLIADRLLTDGLFLLSFPLHPQDKPEQCDPEILYHATSPMLFIRGTRDRHCEGQAMRAMLRRIGAPTELHEVKEADGSFHVLKKSGRTREEIHTEVGSVLLNWIARRLA